MLAIRCTAVVASSSVSCGGNLYGDFCSGWVSSFRLESEAAVDKRDCAPEFGMIANLVSFGEDAAGELYIVSSAGSMYRIVPSGE